MDNNFIEATAHRAWWSLVIRGLLAIAVGVLILARPMQTVAALALVVALYERRVGMPWTWSMAWGVFGLVMAGVAFGNPPATLAALISLIAAFATAGGILLLIAATRIRSAAGEITHNPHSHYPHAAAR